MRFARSLLVMLLPVVMLGSTGCAVKSVDLSTFDRPARAPELSAYDVFVGEWNWEAEMLNATEGGRHWKGTAEWEWTLDNRYLHGTMSATSPDAQFEAEGFWGWHPKSKKYTWAMYNNWGYPQHGKAKYHSADRHWKMRYKSVGLDGSTSYGRYEMKVIDNNTLEWTMVEWADPFHMVKKTEMTGTYRRR
jgi:hypothetical protein